MSALMNPVAVFTHQASTQVWNALDALTWTNARQGTRTYHHIRQAYGKIERIYGDLEQENARAAESNRVNAHIELMDALAITNTRDLCSSLVKALIHLDRLADHLNSMSMALYERDGANELTQF